MGRSFEDRPIELITLGTGPRRVMAWSQMHGDEPTHTSVLLQLVEQLSNPETNAHRELLTGVTLLLIPLLNPDGAERGWRFNGQGIDINRDARALASPEARVLHDAIIELRPEFAFNLHNQNRRDRMPDGAEPVALSLLAPPCDEKDSVTSSVQTARKIASVVLDAAGARCGGRVLRYGADFMPRAFGEWVQSQGVATVLIEACNLPGGCSQENVDALENLHRDALLETLTAIADGSYQQADPQQYLNLPPQAEHRLFDLLLRGGELLQPWGDARVTADVGINDVSAASIRPQLGKCEISDIGDLEPHGGLVELDATGCVVVAIDRAFFAGGNHSAQVKAFMAQNDGNLQPQLQRGKAANLAVVEQGRTNPFRLRHLVLGGNVVDLKQ